MPIEISDNPKEFSDFELRGWEDVSQSYEQHFMRLTSQSVDAVLDAVFVQRDQSLLDVCCGPGMLTGAAVERGIRATGLDFSHAAVNIARAHYPQADFQEDDAEALSFADNSFDAVICNFGIIHVPNPQRALSEMHRVLKPGGRIAVSTWEAPSPGNGFGLLFGTIKTYADMNIDLPHGPDFFQFSDSGKLDDALLATGFTEPSTEINDQTWEFTEPAGFINAFVEGSVRSRPLIEAQSDDIRATIINTVIAGTKERFAKDGMYKVPMPALIGSAVKGQA